MSTQSSSKPPSSRPSSRPPPSETAEPSGTLPSSKLAPGLYLVATPIGNLRDVTLRALDVLAGADVIACEDTRVTRKLLAAYGIKTPLVTYHEHNAESMRPKLIKRLEGGEVVALVSDAGTPLISDPGHKLVRAAAAAGLPVTTLPGPSAPLAALVVSGLPSDRFCFVGFLPPRAGARRRALEELAGLPATLLVLESARRLPKTLAEMAALFGPRPAAVARELTKLYEEVRRDSLDALARHYGEAGAPKGEVVIVIGAPAMIGEATDDDALDRSLRDALAGASLRDAVAEVAAATGRPRREVYRRALALSRAEGEPEAS
ncbi:MAG: 16S rRNA (cytidine(1402)-2'-O)-methyltransferase [Kiloniellales bacterium]